MSWHMKIFEGGYLVYFLTKNGSFETNRDKGGDSCFDGDCYLERNLECS